MDFPNGGIGRGLAIGISILDPTVNSRNLPPQAQRDPNIEVNDELSEVDWNYFSALDVALVKIDSLMRSMDTLSCQSIKTTQFVLVDDAFSVLALEFDKILHCGDVQSNKGNNRFMRSLRGSATNPVSKNKDNDNTTTYSSSGSGSLPSRDPPKQQSTHTICIPASSSRRACIRNREPSATDACGILNDEASSITTKTDLHAATWLTCVLEELIETENDNPGITNRESEDSLTDEPNDRGWAITTGEKRTFDERTAHTRTRRPFGWRSFHISIDRRSGYDHSPQEGITVDPSRHRKQATSGDWSGSDEKWMVNDDCDSVNDAKHGYPYTVEVMLLSGDPSALQRSVVAGGTKKERKQQKQKKNNNNKNCNSTEAEIFRRKARNDTERNKNKDCSVSDNNTDNTNSNNNSNNSNNNTNSDNNMEETERQHTLANRDSIVVVSAAYDDSAIEEPGRAFMVNGLRQGEIYKYGDRDVVDERARDSTTTAAAGEAAAILFALTMLPVFQRQILQPLHSRLLNLQAQSVQVAAAAAETAVEEVTLKRHGIAMQEEERPQSLLQPTDCDDQYQTKRGEKCAIEEPQQSLNSRAKEDHAKLITKTTTKATTITTSNGLSQHLRPAIMPRWDCIFLCLLSSSLHSGVPSQPPIPHPLQQQQKQPRLDQLVCLHQQKVIVQTGIKEDEEDESIGDKNECEMERAQTQVHASDCAEDHSLYLASALLCMLGISGFSNPSPQRSHENSMSSPPTSLPPAFSVYVDGLRDQSLPPISEQSDITNNTNFDNHNSYRAASCVDNMVSVRFCPSETATGASFPKEIDRKKWEISVREKQFWQLNTREREDIIRFRCSYIIKHVLVGLGKFPILSSTVSNFDTFSHDFVNKYESLGSAWPNVVEFSTKLISSLLRNARNPQGMGYLPEKLRVLQQQQQQQRHQQEVHTVGSELRTKVNRIVKPLPSSKTLGNSPLFRTELGESADCGLTVLELFSGIGGMRLALPEEVRGIPIKTVHALDCSDTANRVYEHNFGHVTRDSSKKSDFDGRSGTLRKILLEGLQLEDVDGLADIWTMSPPCQPYTTTRGALQRDRLDNRSKGLFHIMYLLLNMRHLPRWIVLENVAGFAHSEMLSLWLSVMDQLGYCYTEYLISPHSFADPAPVPVVSLAGTPPFSQSCVPQSTHRTTTTTTTTMTPTMTPTTKPTTTTTLPTSTKAQTTTAAAITITQTQQTAKTATVEQQRGGVQIGRDFNLCVQQKDLDLARAVNIPNQRMRYYFTAELKEDFCPIRSNTAGRERKLCNRINPHILEKLLQLEHQDKDVISKNEVFSMEKEPKDGEIDRRKEELLGKNADKIGPIVAERVHVGENDEWQTHCSSPTARTVHSIVSVLSPPLTQLEVSSLLVPLATLSAPWAHQRNISIVQPNTRTSYCFTKGYGKIVHKSTGSLYLCEFDPTTGEKHSLCCTENELMQAKAQPLTACETKTETEKMTSRSRQMVDQKESEFWRRNGSFDANGVEERVNWEKLPSYSGRVRFFDPREVLLLMGFPPTFQWPPAAAASVAVASVPMQNGRLHKDNSNKTNSNNNEKTESDCESGGSENEPVVAAETLLEEGNERVESIPKREILKRYRCIGNSVNVQVVRAVMLSLFCDKSSNLT